MANALSIVCSGRLRVTELSREVPGRELHPGAWFGADGVLLGPPEEGIVEVLDDAELAVIPRACIDTLLQKAVCEAMGPPPPPNEASEPPVREAHRDVRRASRPRVGLALSGGGAKAFAHLGVLKVLYEADVPVDLLAGTSAGAIAAALHCAGRTLPEQFAFADQLRGQVLRRDGMWDFLDSPAVGLIRGERTRALYDHVLDGTVFARLTKPLVIPAADLLTGEAVVLRSGSVAAAIRASAGIPGLYAPWPHAGRYLVEGSLVNPLPVDLLHSNGADLVIASQVFGSTDEIRVVPPSVQSPHYLDLIAARANAILDRHVAAEAPAADVLIRPEVDEYDVLDYPMAEELIALGEAAARARLPEIRRLVATSGTPIRAGDYAPPAASEPAGRPCDG